MPEADLVLGTGHIIYFSGIQNEEIENSFLFDIELELVWTSRNGFIFSYLLLVDVCDYSNI